MAEPTTTTRQLKPTGKPTWRPFAIGVSKRGEPFSVYEYVGDVLIRVKMHELQKVVMPNEHK